MVASTGSGESRAHYKRELKQLQIELVKLQRHFIACDDKVLVVLEGRDAAGKDGVVKRIVQHLSPRETRVVALSKPSDRETASWYFQRFAAHLPAKGEFVLFNRSWYNRPGVELVMGFATDKEVEEFFATVLEFEHMLVRSGIKMFKYYLDISRAEQERRLRERRKNPLTQWKISPIDAQAQKYWNDYSKARNTMLARTNNPVTPWTVVRADNKHSARLNLIRDLLSGLHYKGKSKKILVADSQIVFRYGSEYVDNGMIAQ